MNPEALIPLIIGLAAALLISLVLLLILGIKRFTAPRTLLQLRAELESLQKELREARKDEQFFRGSLNSQLEQIVLTSQHLREQNAALNSALRGSSKTQGIWGEVVLEKVLELSGLREGRDYKKQLSLVLDDGRRVRPDVIVLLPRKRFVVVDAKVSLTAFARYSASLDSGRSNEDASKEHAASLRGHIKELSRRDYSSIHGARSIELVLLFLPVETALSLAMERDPEILAYALERSVIPVSPSTLLLALRIINFLWEREEEESKAAEILRRTALLFKRAELAYTELESLIQKLGAAANSAEKLRSSFTHPRLGLIHLAGQLEPHDSGEPEASGRQDELS